MIWVVRYGKIWRTSEVLVLEDFITPNDHQEYSYKTKNEGYWWRTSKMWMYFQWSSLQGSIQQCLSQQGTRIFRAITTNKELQMVYAKVLELPFLYGCTYLQWEKTIQSLLIEEALPYVHRWRILKLMEHDYNRVFKLMVGRKFAAHDKQFFVELSRRRVLMMHWILYRMVWNIVG